MSNKRDIRIMGEALRQAAINLGTLEGGPFGAVITRGEEVIASSRNTVVSDSDPTAHAEINAIREAARLLGTYNLSGCTIYSSCEPCPMCLAAIWWARLDACFYAATRKDAARAGFDDEAFYEEIRLPSMERKVPFTHITPEEGAKIFEEWISRGHDIGY